MGWQAVHSDVLEEARDTFREVKRERDQLREERDRAEALLIEVQPWIGDRSMRTKVRSHLARINARKENQEIDNEPAFGMSDGEAREAARIRAEERHARKEKP